MRVEYHWLEGKYDQLPALMADLVRPRVRVRNSLIVLGAIHAPTLRNE